MEFTRRPTILKKGILFLSVIILLNSCGFPRKKIANSNFSLINLYRPAIGYLVEDRYGDFYWDVYTPYGDTILDEIKWDDRYIYVSLTCHSESAGCFKINYHLPVEEDEDIPRCISYEPFDIDTIAGKNVRMGIFFQQTQR